VKKRWDDGKVTMTRGDDEFADFARLSSAWLIQAAYLLTGDRLEAEDLAQAALVRTYAAWPRVRRDGAHAYARTVLMNLTRDRWRRPLREYAAAEVPDRADARDLADDVTNRRLLVDLLDTLAPQERAVILLRHYFDLSEAQAAAQLGVSVGTIKSTNARALAKLRITPRALHATIPGGET
jgi:RNA polymerase sigma-70 factor (sigma-E family)